jgi:phage antirepressor YoqD-like protein
MMFGFSNLNDMELIKQESSNKIMNSIEIAKLTKKEHKNVLSDIRKMLNELDIEPANFSARYIDKKGESRPCFILPKRECLVLASGYNIKLRAKIIDRWAELELKLLPQNYIQALESLLKSEKEKEQLKLEAQTNAPKVENYDKFIDSSSLQGFKEVSNMLGYGRNTFMKMLRDMKILNKHNLPYQRFLDAKYFEVKESTQNGFNIATTYVTPKGIEYLTNKLK